MILYSLCKLLQNGFQENPCKTIIGKKPIKQKLKCYKSLKILISSFLSIITFKKIKLQIYIKNYVNL